MSQDISVTIIYGLIGLFSMVLIYYIAVTTNGFIAPIISDMNPNNTVGVTAVDYDAIIDDLEEAPNYVFYISFTFIFIFIAVKVLYEKESTSRTYGDGGYF